jgi:hypothetical protein
MGNRAGFWSLISILKDEVERVDVDGEQGFRVPVDMTVWAANETLRLDCVQYNKGIDLYSQEGRRYLLGNRFEWCLWPLSLWVWDSFLVSLLAPKADLVVVSQR